MAKIKVVGEYMQEPVPGYGMSGDPSGIGQAYQDGSLGFEQPSGQFRSGSPRGSYQDGSLGEAFRDGSLGTHERVFRDGSLGASIRPTAPGDRLLRQATSGLVGQNLGEIKEKELAGLVAIGILVRGVAGYFAGCAMDRKYRWWGAGSAAVGGALGLGILGFIVYRKKH